MPSEKLVFQLADAAQREQSFHNTHDVWSRGMSLADHVALRLRSPLHNRAEIFVGCLDDRVVTALARHPLEFQLRGRKLMGFGIGSVHTMASYRRRGFAADLLAWVEGYCAGRGDQLAVLYSDINPDFYARLGYRQSPAWRGWRELAGASERPAAPAAGGDEPRLSLVPFDGPRELEPMAALYAEYHGAQPLSIDRSEAYWRHLFERQPKDLYFWLDGPAGQRVGYVRLKPKEEDLLITDYALRCQAAGGAVDEEGLLSAMYRALATIARQHEAKRLGGWLPDRRSARVWFDLGPRRDEIPMFKPLDPSVTVDDEAIAHTDCLCELDHV